MGNKKSKAIFGIATILSAITFAGAQLPEPFNWIVLALVVIFGFGLILDFKGII